MPKKRIGVSRARLKRLLANKVDSLGRYVNFTQSILKLIKQTTTIESDSLVSVAGPIVIKSVDDPGRDPPIMLIIEPNATVSISN